MGNYSIFLKIFLAFIQCVDSNDIITQNVYLPEGWSMFSIYGLTSNMNLDNILTPISSDIIMAKDNYGAVFYLSMVIMELVR